MYRLLILLTVLTSSLKAQPSNSNIFPGELLSAKKASFGDFIAVNDGSFYTFGADGIGPEPFKSTGEFHICKYDIGTLTLQNDIELEEFEFKGNEAWYRTIVRNKTGTHVLLESHDYKKGIKYLIHRKLGLKGFTSSPKIIATSNQKYKSFNVFNLYLSRDSSKVFIYADKESKSSEVIPHIYILDQDFESIWDAPLNLPTNKERIKPMSMTVSNEGNIYLLALAKDGKINEGDFSNTDYTIYSISPEESKPIYDFNQYAYPIHNGVLQADIRGKLLFFAFVKEVLTSGISLFFDQKNDKIVSENQIDFKSNESLSLNRNNLFADLADTRGLQRISYDHFFEWEDGTVTLLAEQYSQYGYEADLTMTTSDAQSIMSITLDQTAQLRSAYVIPKSADVIYGDGLCNVKYYSYIAQKKGEKIQIFYNTHGENMEELVSPTSVKHNFGTFKLDMALVQAELNPKKGITYNMLNRITTSHAKKSRLLDTERFIKSGPNEYIILYMPSLYKFGFARLKPLN